MGAALGGIVVVGALLIVIGVVVHFAGTHWIEALMPPVVTGIRGLIGRLAIVASVVLGYLLALARGEVDPAAVHPVIEPPRPG
jgi:xanthine/uracil permease